MRSARIEDGAGNIIVRMALGAARACALPQLAITPRRHRLWAPVSDLDLLDPASDAVPLLGRDAELERLLAWLASPRGVAVRCLAAPAGAGKTRLAMELCGRAESLDPHWDAGFVDAGELVRFAAGPSLAEWGWPRPTLVVVDGAASAVAPLQRWLGDLAGRDRRPDAPPLRLLLLERSADAAAGWWAELARAGWSAAGAGDLFDSRGPEALPPPEPRWREPLLTAIIDAAGRAGVAGADEAVATVDLDREIEQVVAFAGDVLPLDLLMAGLALARGMLPPAGRAWTRGELCTLLARRELRRIERLALARSLNPDLLSWLAAMATLMGGADRDAAPALIRDELSALRRTGSVAEPAVRQALLEALPAGDGSRIAAIRPEPVGEAAVMVALATLDETQQRHAVARSRARAPESTTGVLVRLARDFARDDDHPAIRWLDEIVLGCGDLEALVRLGDDMPTHTEGLRDRAASIAARIVAVLRDARAAADEPWSPALATALQNLAARLHATGRNDEASAAMEDSTAAWRSIAAHDPERYRGALGGALNDLANLRAGQGRREDALAAAEEAVAVFRAAARSGPEIWRGELAMALHTLADRLGQLGRDEAACAAAAESVALRRSLAEADAAAWRPELACSLHVLAARLRAAGRVSDAAAAAGEAVLLRRETAREAPEASSAPLARSLLLLSHCCEALSRSAPALDHVREALAVLLPEFRRRPRENAVLMDAISRVYLLRCTRAGEDADAALLTPVFAGFARLQEEDETGGDEA